MDTDQPSSSAPKDLGPSSSRDHGQPKRSWTDTELLLLTQIEENILNREEAEGPVTFQCPMCKDSGQLVSEREKGSEIEESAKCRYCEARTAVTGRALSDLDPEVTDLRDVPFMLDKKGRLVHREPENPTAWIFPSGARCNYDGTKYKAFEPISQSAYKELADIAKKARRYFKEV